MPAMAVRALCQRQEPGVLRGSLSYRFLRANYLGLGPSTVSGPITARDQRAQSCQLFCDKIRSEDKRWRISSVSGMSPFNPHCSHQIVAGSIARRQRGQEHRGGDAKHSTALWNFMETKSNYAKENLKFAGSCHTRGMGRMWTRSSNGNLETL